MEITEGNEGSFGIEVVLQDGDKTAPCCPHGEVTIKGKHEFH